MEHGAVGGSRDAHGGEDALGPKRTQDGDAVPMTTGCRAWGALAAGAPAIEADQVGQSSALVDEHQALHGDLGDRFRPGSALLLDHGLVLLGRAQGPLFFASAAGA